MCWFLSFVLPSRKQFIVLSNYCTLNHLEGILVKSGYCQWRVIVFFLSLFLSLSRKRFRQWVSVTIPTLCHITPRSWWRMSCGWSWSCSVVVSPAHLFFFSQSKHFIFVYVIGCVHMLKKGFSGIGRHQDMSDFNISERNEFSQFLKAASKEDLKEAN